MPRGICLENGKCECNIFFAGEFCEKFVGCPPETKEICATILNANGFSSQDYLKNEKIENSGKNNDLEGFYNF